MSVITPGSSTTRVCAFADPANRARMSVRINMGAAKSLPQECENPANMAVSQKLTLRSSDPFPPPR